MAARQGSMTNAAHELGVTQTAVSHQIRVLEEYLSTRLFVRDRGRLSLTGPGRAWAAALSDVFERLHAANRRLRAPPRTPERPMVSITAIPSFTAGWLVPHLGGFFAIHRDVDVRISPSERLVDLEAEGMDLGIRYGLGRYPQLVVEKLFADAWVVVCAPELAPRVRRIADLRRVPLLRDDEPDGWARWLERRGAGAGALDLGHGRELTDSAMVVAAAVGGQGVALARWSLAADPLAVGLLVRPFPRTPLLPTGRAYYLVGSAATLARPEVAAFRAWLVTEIAHALGAALGT
ncbi:MAG: LysR family transcriptional regulator [Deltaproteobacteria bacterium]|nr:LysR family transcriptional regulator [Deltaproteobacteria bacterium]